MQDKRHITEVFFSQYVIQEMFLDIIVQRTGWKIFEVYKLNRYLEAYRFSEGGYGINKNEVIEIIRELQTEMTVLLALRETFLVPEEGREAIRGERCELGPEGYIILKVYFLI